MIELAALITALAAVVAWVCWGERKGHAIDDAAEAAYWRIWDNIFEEGFKRDPEKFKGSLRYERWKETGR